MKTLDKELKSKIDSSREFVACDFTELDEIRQVMKESIQETQLNLGRNYRGIYTKGVYDHSYFYVGRGVTNFRFSGIRLPRLQINRVVFRLKELYPHYKIYILDSGTVVIYTRGDRKDG